MIFEQVNISAKSFSSMPLRQKILVLISSVAVVYLIWYFSVGNHIFVLKESLRKDQARMLAQIDERQENITLLEQGYNAIDIEPLKTKAEALEREIQTIDDQLKQLSSSTVPANQLAEIFREVLIRQTNVDLLEMSLLPKEEVVIQAESDSMLYKHGLSMRLSGDFSSIVNYLQSLEALPWKFFWKDIDYNVAQYPKAYIVISIYTLSLDKGFFGV